MTEGRSRSVLSLAGRALLTGVLAMVAIPFVLAYGLLAVSHLAGHCGPGTSGGCEMGAAAIGLYAVIPAFVLGAAVSLFRDLRRARS